MPTLEDLYKIVQTGVRAAVTEAEDLLVTASGKVRVRGWGWGWG